MKKQSSDSPVSPSNDPKTSGADVVTEYWWRDVYFKAGKHIKWDPFDLRSMEGQMTERAAWIYELVCRLPEVKEGIAKIGKWKKPPSFLQLENFQMLALQIKVEKLTGFRPPFKPGVRSSDPRKTGYSQPIPQYQFDLTSDDQPLEDFFMLWIEDQRRKHNITRTKGKKGAASHNKFAIPKTLDWGWVQLMDHQKREGKALTDTERVQKSKALKKGRKLLPKVNKALAQAEEELNTVAESTYNGSIAPNRHLVAKLSSMPDND